jgi:hypothetical protein
VTPGPPPSDDERPPLSVRRVLGAPWLLLATVLVGFALLGSLAITASVAVAVVAVALGAAARLARPMWVHALAPVPPLAGLAVLAIVAVPTGVTALYGGLAVLAFLLWVADDPDRLPGGASRGLARLLVPALGLGIAWASAFLLPGGVAPLGAGVALLVIVVVAAALLLRSPGVFDRDAAATS